MIRDATPSDAIRIAEIYNHYITHSIATFEEQPLTAAEMQERMSPQQFRVPWLVMEGADGIVGYAYASRWNVRSAYRFTREASVYLSPQHIGKGHGTQLYRNLLDRLRVEGVHVVIGGIALPNAASIRLHEKMGFRHEATLKEVGWKFGKWIDVGYWQLTGLNTVGR